MLAQYLLLPRSEMPFHKAWVKVTNSFRFVKSKKEAGELLLSLGNELILVVFDLTRVAFG
jgi:hypothetical protein